MMTMKKKRKKGSTEFVPGDLVRSTSIRPYNLRHVDESHLLLSNTINSETQALTKRSRTTRPNCSLANRTTQSTYSSLKKMTATTIPRDPFVDVTVGDEVVPVFEKTNHEVVSRHDEIT